MNRVDQVRLPWPPAALNPNRRSHWNVKASAAKCYRFDCFALCLAAKLSAPDGPLELHLDFYPPDRRHRDDDNAIAAFKAGRDGIADALKRNDKDFRTVPRIMTETGGYVLATVRGVSA